MEASVRASDRGKVDVNRVVADLRTIDHATVWERTMAVGKVVFEGIFAGNAIEWRAKRGNKSTSLRKLVAHPHCPFKKSALSNAVNVYLFVKDSPDVCNLKITPSHIGCVSGIQSSAAVELLKRASENDWSIRQLAEHVKLERREAGERRGRPRSPTAQRAETLGRRGLRALERMCDLLAQADLADEGCRNRVRALLGRVDTACSRIHGLPQLASAVPRAPHKAPVPLSNRLAEDDLVADATERESGHHPIAHADAAYVA
jgi:hypothetical protein